MTNKPNAKLTFKTRKLTIAIDFDGTIVEDKYPKIGAPRTFAFETLKLFQDVGHRLILWTYREGKQLEEAISFCQMKGLNFYAINKSHPEEKKPYSTRKIHADIFIDDRNFGGLPEWGVIGQKILGHEIINSKNHFIQKKSIWKSIFRW